MIWKLVSCLALTLTACGPEATTAEPKATTMGPTATTIEETAMRIQLTIRMTDHNSVEKTGRCRLPCPSTVSQRAQIPMPATSVEVLIQP